MLHAVARGAVVVMDGVQLLFEVARLVRRNLRHHAVVVGHGQQRVKGHHPVAHLPAPARRLVGRVFDDFEELALLELNAQELPPAPSVFEQRTQVALAQVVAPRRQLNAETTSQIRTLQVRL